MTPTQSDVLTVLRAFLLAVLPGLEVVLAQVNRVPEPKGSDFVTMTPLFQNRLSTNVDTYQDCAFTGSIADATLTVSAVALGTIEVGATLFGAGIALGTTIAALGSGTGGVGTYTVSQAQSVGAEPMASGTEAILQPTRMTVQLDVHGPNSADNAQTVSTLFRDAYATTFFDGSGVSPFYADDPKQMPFENDQSQVEERWTLDAVMQSNSTITNLPQQFADQLQASVVDVETYPA